jgi:ABC-type branched-subunit amino acid transport system permease subunit
MDLLERYLQAVRFFLPRGSQDDIVRELEEDLRAQMDDRESQLGRTMTDGERSEILKRHGHPMLVAGRYRTHQRLIGPAFFPMYALVLKLGLGVCLLVTAVLATVGAVMEGDAASHFGSAILEYPGRALMVFAWTTLSFAAIDYALTRWDVAYSWDPKTLPRLQPNANWTSRLNSLVELIATVVGLGLAYLVCRYITTSKLGRVLLALRDAESRVRFLGYSVTNAKLFVFTVSAVLAGVAGALYVPQVGIINPSEFSPANSIEIAIWVSVGGRGTLLGAIIGAALVNLAKTWLTSAVPEIWLFFLGGLFVASTLLFPRGAVGLFRALPWPGRKQPETSVAAALAPTLTGEEPVVERRA